ncbi:TetR/AcrR family transcriptional regulator [Trebonia sp.]|uniref:TetR/AcrR family transcriptional regulator n=1 Tax=Trebonia sp. TaxID=2767075 RepID=UPI0026306169|nr:TetR/AcrR family transcriptional regulator [Trebonia sp.]
MRARNSSRGVQEPEALAAAYACFARTGLQRTTVEDIARELGRSRPVVYRHFSDKHDAFRKVAQQLLDEALDQARSGAEGTGPAAGRVLAVVDAKLELAARVHRDSPHHAREILAADSNVLAGQVAAYLAQLGDLIVTVLQDAVPAARAREVADILLALTRGLEDDLSNPGRARALLRLAVEQLTTSPVSPAG